VRRPKPWKQTVRDISTSEAFRQCERLRALAIRLSPKSKDDPRIFGERLLTILVLALPVTPMLRVQRYQICLRALI
jgi:hypothetical protein